MIPPPAMYLATRPLFSSADMELYFCRAMVSMALMMKTEWVSCMLEFNNFMMKINQKCIDLIDHKFDKYINIFIYRPMLI